MKPQIATSIEQSRRLLSCGVDPKTADLVWLDDGNNRSCLTIYRPIISNRYIVVEAWSLNRMLELLPMSIEEDNGYYQLNLTACPHEEDCYKWSLSYYEKEWETSRCYNEAPTPIEACVKAIEWLTEQGYPLNKIEE